jgi:hypothetical protein
MKICVTTSDRYHHILPVFFYLYNKYWGAPFELVGYKKPECELPDNCTWVSLGEQGDKNNWSTSLRAYFEQQPDEFIWLMEDTLLKEPVDNNLCGAVAFTGKVCLTDDVIKREHRKDDLIAIAHPASRYRLSTQPSIWNKKYLLQYLTPGLSPWDFETLDPKNDGWDVIGFIDPPVKHNEGVRRHDIYKLNLDGMKPEDIEHINEIYKC